jgi:nucleotidyltransferase/DNA polymerase involved in DNA repair
MKRRVEPDVYAPMRRSSRRGRGFSPGEIKEAGLTLHEAERLGIWIDKRRRSLHPQNVKRLRDTFVRRIPLTEVKGIGETTAVALRDAGVLDAYDLVHVDLETLSGRVRYSMKSLLRWRNEAKILLEESPP